MSILHFPPFKSINSNKISVTQTLYEIGTEVFQITFLFLPGLTLIVWTNLLFTTSFTFLLFLMVALSVGDVFSCSSYIKADDEMYTSEAVPRSLSAFSRSLASTAPNIGAHFATNMNLGSRPIFLQRGLEVEEISTYHSCISISNLFLFTLLKQKLANLYSTLFNM